MSPGAGLCVFMAVTLPTGVQYCFTELLPCLKGQGWTHLGSLSPSECGHKSDMVKPTGALQSVGEVV